jgi:hypothetical protein
LSYFCLTPQGIFTKTNEKDEKNAMDFGSHSGVVFDAFECPTINPRSG